MDMVKGIAFDMDGTLLNSQEVLINAEIKAFGAMGVNVSHADLKKFGGVSVKDMAKELMPGFSDKDIIELRRIRAEEALKCMEEVVLFPETKPVLRKLRGLGIRLSIATGLGHELLPVFLEKTGLSKMVDFYVSADQVKHGKPAPDVFLRAFELMQVDTSNGLVVGDSPHDIMGAKAANIKSVLISREQKPDCRPDYVISDLTELLELVK